MELSEIQDLIKRVVRGCVRNEDWREDCNQEAWVGVLRAIQLGNEPNPNLVARIAYNASYGFLRKRQRDPVNSSETELERRLGGRENGAFILIQVQEYLGSIPATHAKVVEYVLVGAPFNDLSDLGQKHGTSKATCSRILNSFRKWLIEEQRVDFTYGS